MYVVVERERRRSSDKEARCGCRERKKSKIQKTWKNSSNNDDRMKKLKLKTPVTTMVRTKKHETISIKVERLCVR